MSGAYHYFAYSIRSIQVDSILQAAISELGSGIVVERCE